MRVIGVIDLLGGLAVHARAGRRESYAPVRAVARWPIEPGDALALARAYVDRLGLTELYAADLDAILGRLRRDHDDTKSPKKHHEENRWPGVPPYAPSQDALSAALAGLGGPLWLDAGVSSADQARHALGLGAARVVVGLETLQSYDALATICATVGGDRVAFSLDLREGQPIVAAGETSIRRGEPAHLVAARAAAAGAGAVIVIDLARVGTGRGLDLGLIARVRDAAAGLTLLAGGGVRGMEDIARLADAGCDGVLVATALHNGRLGAAEIASCAHTHRSFSR